MNIGVFVPNNSINRMKCLLRTYKNVNFEFLPYDSLEEVKEAYHKNAKFLDGYFFSGLLSYIIIEEKFGKIDKPVAYLKISEADFYKRLFYIMLNHPEINLSRVFLDFHAESKKIADFVDDLPEEQRPMIISEEDIYITDNVYERIFQQHRDLHESNKVDWSFTRFANIVELMEENEYNYHYFDISNETIHHTLIELINEINLHILKDNQIVCGYLTMGDIPEEVREIKLLNLHSLLLDYNHKNNNQIVIRKANNHFEMTTNFVEIQKQTNHFTSCSLLHYLSQFFSEPIHIGWGIGKTFIQAQTNAKKACGYSVHNQLSSTYIAENDDAIIGPLVGKKKENSFQQVVVDNEKLEEVQKKSNITRDKINKILLVFNKLENTKISSTLFAETLGVSVRSANRILKEAEEKDIVISEEDTQSGLQGRPRKLYSLNRKIFETG